VITRETTGSDQLTGEGQGQGQGQGFSQRAAASAVSSGRVLNAIEALGADLRTAFTIVALHVKPDKMPELKRETFTA
jgi:hypothetical protein